MIYDIMIYDVVLLSDCTPTHWLLQKLKEFEAKNANVIRNGKLQTVDRAELVPGDLVKLAVGEKIPAGKFRISDFR